jgi:SAM-dependent methyltransferase
VQFSVFFGFSQRPAKDIRRIVGLHSIESPEIDMTTGTTQKSGERNGQLWSARAREWADLQEVQFRHAYETVFETVRLRADAAYCDLGCGSGLALQIAEGRGARVAGLDAAEALVRIARSRVPGGDLRIGDLEALPFPDDAFDLVTGFNSFQYATHPAGALSEARRVTRPDGRIVVMTWGPPEGMEAASLVAALKPLLPPPPPGAPGPFALSDAEALKALAVSAGLHPLEVNDVECVWQYHDLDAAVHAFGSAGVAVRAAEHSGQEAVDRAHAQALAAFRQADGSYRLRASFRWLAARK